MTEPPTTPGAVLYLKGPAVPVASVRRQLMPNLDGHAGTGLHRAPWMAGIAQLVERQVVVLDVTGSSPVARPTFLL